MQTSTQLHTGTPALWRARFQSVGDAYWKEWIEHALAHCTGVILDMSHESASLHWELDTATRIVGVERILILSRGQQIAGVDDRIETHNLQTRRMESMADAVSRWGADVARKLWGQAAPPVVRAGIARFAPCLHVRPRQRCPPTPGDLRPTGALDASGFFPLIDTVMLPDTANTPGESIFAPLAMTSSLDDAVVFISGDSKLLVVPVP